MRREAVGAEATGDGKAHEIFGIAAAVAEVAMTMVIAKLHNGENYNFADANLRNLGGCAKKFSVCFGRINKIPIFAPRKRLGRQPLSFPILFVMLVQKARNNSILSHYM